MDISSTRHSNLSPGSRIEMICCVSRAKIAFEGSKIDRRMHFVRIFAFFKILEFLVILASFQAQIWIPGAISCPGQVPNRPGIEFQANSDFRLHMVFMCRPCEPQSSSAKPPQNLKPRWADSFFIVVSMSEFGVLIELLYFTHNAKHHQNSQTGRRR